MCCSDKQAAIAPATAGCTAAPERRPDNNVHPVKPEPVRLVTTGQRRNGGHFVAPVDVSFDAPSIRGDVPEGYYSASD